MDNKAQFLIRQYKQQPTNELAHRIVRNLLQIETEDPKIIQLSICPYGPLLIEFLKKYNKLQLLECFQDDDSNLNLIVFTHESFYLPTKNSDIAISVYFSLNINPTYLWSIDNYQIDNFFCSLYFYFNVEYGGYEFTFNFDVMDQDIIVDSPGNHEEIGALKNLIKNNFRYSQFSDEFIKHFALSEDPIKGLPQLDNLIQLLI